MPEILDADLLDLDDTFNLAVIRDAGAILLGRKTRGFGAGKLVLPGGKDRGSITRGVFGLVPGTIGVSREVNEETGLEIAPLGFKVVANLVVTGEDEDIRDITVFEAVCKPGTELHPSNEFSELGWYSNPLPYGEMPEDYRVWLPHVLAGYLVRAFFEEEGRALTLVGGYRQRLDVPDDRPELLLSS